VELRLCLVMPTGTAARVPLKERDIASITYEAASATGIFHLSSPASSVNELMETAESLRYNTVPGGRE